MLVVLADDFSGAAEIGGIGFRYGLHTEVQVQFNPDTKADLVVIDANTRLLKESDAITKTEEIITAITGSNLSVKIFKKVDSVMRGHIVPEINVLQKMLGFSRIFLLPANPMRGRKIISGSYFVNGTSLDKTVFSVDPDYPMTCSSMEALLKNKNSNLRHRHITPDSAVPALSLITGDVSSKEDFKKYLIHASEGDLCCGAAEFFEAWLENLGFDSQRVDPASLKSKSCEYVLILNGSTVKSRDEADHFERLGIPKLSLPGMWQGDRFHLAATEETAWYAKVENALNRTHVAAISIDLPVKQAKGVSEIFSGYFVELMRYLSGRVDMNNMHIGLTGGATASAVIRAGGDEGLIVLEEVAAGVVTIARQEGFKGIFTVKPGSYPWPAAFLERITDQNQINE